jgi:GNAT superfamily N-acetyltransferase
VIYCNLIPLFSNKGTAVIDVTAQAGGVRRRPTRAGGEVRGSRRQKAVILQDLFVDEAVRGRGAARALIERVAAAAREHGAISYYWHTQEGNATARALYGKATASSATSTR